MWRLDVSLGIGSNLIMEIVPVIQMLPPPPPLMSSLVNAREDVACTECQLVNY